MNIIKVMVRVSMGLALGSFCMLSPPQALADKLPNIILAGFDTLTKGAGFDGVVYIWQKGGLIDGDRKATEMASYLRRVSQTAGGFRSYEVLKADNIGGSSKVIYLALNLQRGAVYGRFALYRTDKDWVVQDMDFSTRPEAVMPWLALAAEKNNE